MKRYILMGALAFGALMGCRDRADNVDRDTPVTTGTRNPGTDTSTSIRNDADKAATETKGEFGQMKKDIDEEFKDRNEPGDQYGSETDAVRGGERGASDTVGGKADHQEDRVKDDLK